MILKGSQRGGAVALAKHLSNDKDNDHVEVLEVSGFLSDDLHGAFREMQAVAEGTQCKQYMFSLSLNPPQDAKVDTWQFIEAIERAEKALGLEHQPRIVVSHEKEGRRHAHVVWSRVDASQMKAINMSYFKTKLNELAKELYLDHGWELPEGFKENGWKNPLNFTLAEWQQAKRLGLDPREVKQFLREAWSRSDDFKSFRAAIEAGGFYLARGDKRSFVVLDTQGKVFSLSRMTGVHPHFLQDRLGNPSELPSVARTQKRIRSRSVRALKTGLKEAGANGNEALNQTLRYRLELVTEQRDQRKTLREMQQERWEKESRERAARFRKGLLGVWDRMTGRSKAIRGRNAVEVMEAQLRDLEEREKLFGEQRSARQELQVHIARAKSQRREAQLDFIQQRRALQRWHASPYRGRSMSRRNDRTELDLDFGM